MDTIAPGRRGLAERQAFGNVATTVASKRERRWALGIALVAALLAVAFAPFGHARAPEVITSIPAFAAAAFVAMALTAALLFAQYRAGGSAPLAILALAYSSPAVLSLLYALTFPLAFNLNGLLDAGSQTAAWLYIGWHVSFCVLLALYVLAERGPFAENLLTVRRLAIGVGTILFAFVLIVTLGHDALPAIVNNGQRTQLFSAVVAPALLAIVFATTVSLIAATRLRTRSHLWLSVVMCVMLVETIVFSYESGSHYSYGWYCARIELTAASIIFLVVLQAQYGSLLRRTTESNLRLEKRNAQVEEFIKLQESVAAALPSRVRVIDVILEFALRCTEGEGSVMETLHDGEIYFEAAAGTMKPHVGMRKPCAGSMSGLCVERGEALCCNDTSTISPPVRARSELLNIGSMIAVPITLSADVTVVLKVTAERRFAFSASDLTTLQLVATSLLSGLRAAEEFTVLEAAELEQRLYARQLQALHAIATTASGQGGDQIDEALRLGLEQLDLDWAFLGVIDESAAELIVERSFARNGEPVLDAARRVPLSGAGLAAVTRSDGVFIVADANALDGCERYRGWSSYISVPLHVGGKRYGAVGFTSRDVRLAAFSEMDAKFLAVAAELIASAIESRISSDRLALSETRYRALTDAMPQLVWVIDEASNLHYVNARWSAYTGLDLERSVTMASEVIVGSEYRTVAPQSGTPPPKEFECEVRLRRHDGLYRWHLVRGVPLHDTRGYDARWIVTGTDIEERKSAEAAYARLHDAALAATEAKSRFLATMSHELRTPMNGVIGMTELLLSTPLSVEQNEYTQIVHDSGLSLLRLLNDILDYSKIEAGKLEIEAIDFELQKQIDSVVHLMRSQFDARGVTLTSFIDPAIPADVVGDPGRLRQILINLVGNALKFTERGGYVHVIVTSKGIEDNRVPVEILVEDTGIGIPPDVVERLFVPFAQGDESTTRKYGGTGLGLSICAQLVALMHGRITVESTVGKGSSFRFGVEFTLAQGRQHLPSAGSREPAAVERLTGRAGKILLVEDNDINTRLAVAQFKKIGFDVGVVVNGRLAVEAVQRERYDLVFMDCHMPEMDGFAATSEIRQLERGTVRRLPIIALTADARHEDHERCLTAGMDDYLSKPTTLGKLRAAVDRWLPG